MTTFKAEASCSGLEYPKADFGAEGMPNAVASTAIPQALTDNDLMMAIARGDASAFQLLMQRHIKSMLALARRITLNYSDADEVVQEAFLRVWTNAAKWDTNGPAQLRTWLHRVVTNLAIDRTRKPQNLPLEAAGDPMDLRYDTERDFGAEEEGRKVRAALNQLNARQRAAIALSYFEDMSDAEAAGCLKISVGALESLLVRARRQLKITLHNLHETGD